MFWRGILTDLAQLILNHKDKRISMTVSMAFFTFSKAFAPYEKIVNLCHTRNFERRNEHIQMTRN